MLPRRKLALRYPRECKPSEVDNPYPGKIYIVDSNDESCVETYHSNKETMLLSKERETVDLSGFEEIVCAHIREMSHWYGLPHAKSVKWIVAQAGTKGILVTRYPRPYGGGIPGVKSFSGPYYQHAYFESQDGSKIIELKAKIDSTPYITAETFRNVVCSLQYTD
jgi:hypothetical protein